MNRKIARAAGSVMLALAASMLIGLLRQILVANAFGTGRDLDAFAAANRVSETLFLLVAGGALGSAFIPTFTGLLTRGENDQAWKLASAISNILLVCLIVTAILAGIFAYPIVRYLLVPGFADIPGKLALTVSLMRLMLPSIVFFGLSGLVIGILNSHQVFFIPALAPSMYSLGMIFGVLVLSPKIGIYGLGWGVLIGSISYLGVQIPSLIRLRGKYSPIFGFKLPAVRQVGRLFIPRVFGVAIVQLNFWINILLASHMVEGAINSLSYAFMIMLMPQTVIAQAIAIAAMPTFSAQIARGQVSEMRSSLVATLRGVLLLSIPATIGLIVYRQPIVEILLQRGAFSTDSTTLVTWALLWYSVGLVGHSVVEILSRAFYSLSDTKTPVIIGAAAMALNILLSLCFIWLFSSLNWMPHGGLALANSTATVLEMMALSIIIRRKLHGLDTRQLIQSGLAGTIGSLVMLFGSVAWLKVTENESTAIRLVVGIIIGVFLYGGVLWLVRVPEIHSLVRWGASRVHLRS